MASTKVTFVTGTAEVRRRDRSHDPQATMLQTEQHFVTEPSAPLAVAYVDGKCSCCPYGYHIDLDFLNFCSDLERGSTLKNLKKIQRTKRNLRKSMEIMLNEQEGVKADPSSAPPDIVRSTEAERLMHMVNFEQSATVNILRQIDTSVRTDMASFESRAAWRSPDTTEDVRITGSHDQPIYQNPPAVVLTRADSLSSLSSWSTVSSEAALLHQAELIQQQQQQKQQSLHISRAATKVTVSSFKEAADVNETSVPSLKEALADSLQRIKLLEEQIKTIPILQVRLSVLKEEKRLLKLQLKASKSSTAPLTTTVGVGDDSIDFTEETNETVPSSRIFGYSAPTVIATSTPRKDLMMKSPPPTLPKPVKSTSVAIGNHSVLEPYNLQPDLPTGYTVRENESAFEICSKTMIEKESLTVVTRTIGVGDANVFEDSKMQVHEKELRTVIFGQNKAVAKRNVGIECRVATRDVGVLFKCDEEKPATRTIGVNVNYDTSGIFTSLDFKGERELRVALQGVLHRSVRSVGTTCRMTEATAELATMTDANVALSVGCGDEEQRVDVEIRPAVVRKSVATSCKPDIGHKYVSTDADWILDASTNTYQVDSFDKGLMTDKVKQAFASTNTQPVFTHQASIQTDQNVFVGLDQIRHASSNTDIITSHSRGVSTDIVTTHNAFVNTSEKVSELFQEAFKKESVNNIVSEEYLQRKMDTDRKTLDQVKKEAAQNLGEEKETKQSAISRMSDHAVQEKVTLEHSDHESSFLGKSEYSKKSSKYDYGDTHYSSLEISSRSAPGSQSHISSKTSMTSGQEDLNNNASSLKTVEPGNTDERFSETVVEHFILTKDGKKLISEEKITTSSAGTNRSFKQFTHGDDCAMEAGTGSIETPNGHSSDIYESQTGSWSKTNSSSYNSDKTNSFNLTDSSNISVVSDQYQDADKRANTSKVLDSHTLTRNSLSSFQSEKATATIDTTRFLKDKGQIWLTLSSCVKDEGSFDSLAASNSVSTMEVIKVAASESRELTKSIHTSESSKRKPVLKSIMKHSPETQCASTKKAITFAESVTGGTGSSSEEDNNSSDADSTDSFDEGSYNGQEVEVKYYSKEEGFLGEDSPGVHVLDQNIREIYELSDEVKNACSVVGTYLTDSTSIQTKQLNASQEILQQEWFQLSSHKLSSAHKVEDFLSSVNEISSRLLEYVINVADANGNTAIHYCISHCNFDIASLLLDSKVCDTNRRNKAGYTPIMLAGLATVQDQRQYEVIRRLLSLGEVNARATQTQQTALMLAASHGRTEMVKLLIEEGADVNLQDEDGSTALMCACEHGHLEIVNVLLTHPGIDVNLTDSEKSTALTIAMETGHKNIGVVLYKHLNFPKVSSP
ncbi:unnamed protein product [Candidula unifasciata]|uniref:KN motif and ankyrin repeat domain-containing protein 2 n=1 Tax=Candidula unifasciata TaxID=100452 RepID=A0A8S3YFH9_9EUPU|nr:unnamed protein product [Candidula unifasciata]